MATKITFINEIANLCEKTGIDIEDISIGIGLDKRIGSRFLKAGPAYGGSCFPKDVVEVNNFYKDGDLNLPLISNIIKSNNEHLNWTVQQMLMLKNDNNLNKIFLVGAAFKEDTDDLRNSPTLDIYKIFEKIGEEVTILDTEVIVPDHNFINSINEIDSESLIAVMYPLKDQLSLELKNFASENNCIIYYPWN